MALRLKQSQFSGLARAFSVLVMMFAALQGTPAVAQDKIEVSHVQGTTEVPRNPKKVVVFDLASLDTLAVLGVTVAGVPGNLLPDYLAKYKSDEVPKVGTLFEPDYEAVNAIGPDLIIVGGRSMTKYRDLAAIAPTIDLTVDVKDYMGNVTRNVELLGRIFGKEKEAASRLDALRQSIAALHRKAADSGKGLLVLTTGSKMSAYGPGSRFGILHSVFGVQPAAPNLEVSLHGQSISSEFILKTNPDWLFVIDRDAAIGQGTSSASALNNELVAQTQAWKEKKVVYLDPVNWYLVGGGLTSFQAMVDQISDALGKAK